MGVGLWLGRRPDEAHFRHHAVLTSMPFVPQGRATQSVRQDVHPENKRVSNRALDDGRAPVLLDLAAQKLGAAAQLLNPIDPVFDTDPAVEADSPQFVENRVVIIESLADLTVPQPFSIAGRATFFTAEILERPFDQVAVAGVHGNYAMRHPLEQFDRIVTSQIRIARVIVDAKSRMLNRFNQFTKHIHLLRELRVLPKIIFIMIFDDQSDIVLLRIRQASLNAMCSQADTFAEA